MARFKRLLAPLIAVFILATIGVAWTQRWDIYDWYRLRDYQPPTRVVKLADDTAMTPSARRLFYVYYPQLEKKEDFNSDCASSEKTIVLGCYVGGRGIYLADITDKRLTGVLQVTSAHEMLHAAYERLTTTEKKRIDALVDKAFKTVKDERIRKTIDDYRRNDADIPNELHSIMGTEVRSLPAELEMYYKRYFTDRSKTVRYSEQYERAFSERKEQIDSYDQQLSDLKQQIDARETGLTTRQAQLNATKADMDRYIAQKNVSAYNAAVPAYNALVSQYNADVRAVRALIDEYNAVVENRNQLAVEQSELVRAIDSRPATVDKK